MVHRASFDARCSNALHQRREQKQNQTPPHEAIISSKSFKNKHSEARKEKGATAKADAPFLFAVLIGLEEELAAELQYARIVRAGDLSELRVGETRIDVLKFGVVEGIEGLETDFEVRSFMRGQRDALKQGDVPVEEPWADDRILP